MKMMCMYNNAEGVERLVIEDQVSRKVAQPHIVGVVVLYGYRP